MSSAKFVQKFKDMWNPPEDEFDDYDIKSQLVIVMLALKKQIPTK